ncbi:uncharacterized protein LOC128302772 [Anopheles moucheti]|uniref:uncharacterized protein LOC128302772 n=1 Tax=Anopheles moucheti TaxID=186751 RepID=UPI0022F01CA7|nr:uncharacterized protein LOC128302772 [Anopheles moucheti]
MAILTVGKATALKFTILLFCIAFVKCIDNFKTRSSIADNADRWKANEDRSSGSSLWTPEFYEGPDAYKKDFITSNYDEKYSSNIPFYPSKTRNGFSPFSGGSIYSSGGLYDRRPTYPARPIDYGVHDYESSYDYGHGYGLNHPYGSKDITKSVWIPLAGAALLGIAAALVANPVLLHLGVSAGKRKRREATLNAHDLAYRERHRARAQTWKSGSNLNKNLPK